MRKHNTAKESAVIRKRAKRKLTGGIDLGEHIREYDEQIENIGKSRYPEIELLKQVHGVRTLTALTYVLTVEDPYRFRGSRDAGAYFGLRPRRRESGDSRPQLRITKKEMPTCENARRVRVTACSVRTGAAPKQARVVAGSVFRLQHPSDLRTPTGTQPMEAAKKCEWKRGDEARTFEMDTGTKVACHSLVSEHMASRPPVQATLRLAALDLDWTRSRCEGLLLIRGNGTL